MPSHLVLCAVLLGLAACGGGSSGGPAPATSRSFAMGFTTWPYDATTAAVDFSYDEIANRGDVIAHHLDQGVPWQAAFDSSAYPAAVEAELVSRVANTPSGHAVYLAITPLSSGRDDLAQDWTNAGGAARTAPWDTRGFDDTTVIQAYSNWAVDLAGRFAPDYFNIAIEISDLAILSPGDFAAATTLVTATAAAVRVAHPDVEILVSVALKTPGSADATTILAAMPPVVAVVDTVGASVYPFLFFSHANRGDPANLPTTWLSQITAIAGGKPIAITETGWAAETVDVPTYSLNVPCTPAGQDLFVQTMLNESDGLGARFVIWFSVADYDDLWTGALASDPLARLWRDTGLYDGVQVPRASRATWDDWFARDRR